MSEWWRAAGETSFVSYAQNREDVILARALQPDRRTGFWIDVGANHPVSDSVTLAFSQRGWTGINVEPLPEMHALLEAHRPRDVNVAAAAGAEPGSAKLHVGPGAYHGEATLVATHADRWREQGIEPEVVEVPVITLDTIVREHVQGVVDFLKIDAEGSEDAVLAGADWATFRPRVVVVEATAPQDRRCNRAEWEAPLLAADYQFALFDGLNAYYVRPEDRELVDVLSAPANPHDNWLDHRLVTAVQHEGTLTEQNQQLTDQVAQLRDELDAIRNTRTWRYSARLRRAYASARARREPNA